MVDDASIARAAEAWARAQFGAPRRFGTLITAIEPRDEVIHRLVTTIVRRELVESRIATTEKRNTLPSVRYEAIDPFAIEQDALRIKTEHVAACTGCSAAGTAACFRCTGTGRARCSNCGGAGRHRNPATNRMIKCKVCGASGTVACGTCGGDGRVPCSECGGSGRQLAWLTCVESRATRLSLEPASPVAVAHPQLQEQRTLGADDLEAFETRVAREASGPLSGDELDTGGREIVGATNRQVDRRLERVAQQQYLQLAVVRKDVRYAMAGCEGTLVLSGRGLLGATTQEATLPIRRRLWLWLALLVGVAGAAVALWLISVGRSNYFFTANVVAGSVAGLAILGAIPFVGGFLRSMRPGLRIRGLRPVDIVGGAVAVLALAAIPVVGRVTRPARSELDAALKAGELGRAREVLAALEEEEGRAAAARDEDDVLMAEAARAAGAERLAKLDRVAAGRGTRASEAAALARKDRVTTIQGLLDTKHPDQAIEEIEHVFPQWRTDGEIAELHAKGNELNQAACGDDPCRLVALSAAAAARSTPARTEAVGQQRAKLLDRLGQRDFGRLSDLERLRQLGNLAALAAATLDEVTGDEVIATAAATARDWAEAERVSVAVIGADREIAEEIFGEVSANSPEIYTASLDGADLYVVTSSSGKCKGLYVTGPPGHRGLSSTRWPAERILAHAVGRAATVKAPTDTSTTVTKWSEASRKVVARWDDGRLVELRIGDAAP